MLYLIPCQVRQGYGRRRQEILERIGDLPFYWQGYYLPPLPLLAGNTPWHQFRIQASRIYPHKGPPYAAKPKDIKEQKVVYWPEGFHFRIQPGLFEILHCVCSYI